MLEPGSSLAALARENRAGGLVERVREGHGPLAIEVCVTRPGRTFLSLRALEILPGLQLVGLDEEALGHLGIRNEHLAERCLGTLVEGHPLGRHDAPALHCARRKKRRGLEADAEAARGLVGAGTNAQEVEISKVHGEGLRKDAVP